MDRPRKPSHSDRVQRRQLRSSARPSTKNADQARVPPPAPLRGLTGDIDDVLPLRLPATPPPRSRQRSRPVEPPTTARRRSQPAFHLHDEDVADDAGVYDGYRACDGLDPDLRYAEELLARPYTFGSAARRAAVAPRLTHPTVLLVVFVLSVIILATLWPTRDLVWSRWSPLGRASSTVENGLVNIFEQPNPPGDYNLRGAPSLSAAQIDEILASYGSPATGTGRAWVDLGRKYHIDPAFAVAFFIHESSAGTNPGWAGLKPDGSTTHNIGNIICAGYPRCHGRFRDYASWEEGIEDWYRLIDVEYIKGRGTQTVAEIVPIYAPAFENNVQGYITAVTRLVDTWRTNGV